MKNLPLVVVLLFAIQCAFGQSIGVGTATPHSSAALEVSSVTQGMLVPRMTTVQRAVISNPATGLLVYDTNTNSFWFKGSTSWVELIDSTTNVVQQNGTDIYMGMEGNVGIGTMTPSSKLEVKTPLNTSGITHSAGSVLLASKISEVAAQIGTVTAHTLKLVTNDQDRVHIATNGLVGIGIPSPLASLDVARGNGFEGSVLIRGTSSNSHFNYADAEHTYIRGGKPGAHVILNEAGGLGNVGIGTASPLDKLHVLGKARITDKLAIGNIAANAALQFANTINNRKLVLWENMNNDHEFYGFGINGATLRHQVPDESSSHVFFAGTSPTSSKELLRVRGDGNIGIATSNPQNILDIVAGPPRTGSHPTGKALYVTGPFSENSNGVEFKHDNGTQGIGFGFNTIYAAGSNVSQDLGLLAKGTSGAVKFSTNGSEKMRIAGDGSVGIGTSSPTQKLHVVGTGIISEKLGLGVTPNAPLQFANTDQIKKIVLREVANNDHQFSGIGHTADIQSYQVGSLEYDHVFYAAESATHSVERLRIKGNGNVGVGTSNPMEKLEVSGNVKASGTIKVGYVREVHEHAVANGMIEITGCDCPTGTKVLGGGYYNPNALIITGTYPSSDQSAWEIVVANFTGSTKNILIYAICARLDN